MKKAEYLANQSADLQITKIICFMISSSKITEFFCCIDAFFKKFAPLFEQRFMGNGLKLKPQ
jgi:hypothetical protein